MNSGCGQASPGFHRALSSLLAKWAAKMGASGAAPCANLNKGSAFGFDWLAFLPFETVQFMNT